MSIFPVSVSRRRRVISKLLDNIHRLSLMGCYLTHGEWSDNCIRKYNKATMRYNKLRFWWQPHRREIK